MVVLLVVVMIVVVVGDRIRNVVVSSASISEDNAPFQRMRDETLAFTVPVKKKHSRTKTIPPSSNAEGQHASGEFCILADEGMKHFERVF